MAKVTADDTRIKSTAIMQDAPGKDHKEVKGVYVIEVKLGKKWVFPFRFKGKDTYDLKWEAEKALHDLREYITDNGGSIEVG